MYNVARSVKVNKNNWAANYQYKLLYLLIYVHIHTNRHYYGAQPEFATSSDRSFIFSFTQHIFIEQN